MSVLICLIRFRDYPDKRFYLVNQFQAMILQYGVDACRENNFDCNRTSLLFCRKCVIILNAIDCDSS